MEIRDKPVIKGVDVKPIGPTRMDNLKGRGFLVSGYQPIDYGLFWVNEVQKIGENVN